MAKSSKLPLHQRIGTFIKGIGTSIAGKPVAYSSRAGALFGGANILAERVSVDNLMTAWRNHSDVFGCVRELSENCGVAGYYWENVANPDADANPESVKRAEAILNVRGRTFRQFKRRMIQDAEITGNAFMHVEKAALDGKPLTLSFVDPRTMHVVTDSYGTIVRWIQRYKGSTVEFQPDEILHFKLTDDPNSPVFGLSALETMFWDVKTDLAAQISNFAFFENDAIPAAQYILEEDLDDEEVDKAISKLQEQLRGAANRHQGAVMKGIKEVKMLGISQKDMEFHVLRRFTTEKVCAAYGVPKSILNYTDEVNYANGQEQTKKFWEGTIEPLQEAVQEFLNTQVLPAFGITDIKLCFETRKFDDREMREQSVRSNVQLGIMTINEAREEMDMEPLDETDNGELVNKPIIYVGNPRTLDDVGMGYGDGGLPTAADSAGLNKALGMIDQAAQRYADQNQPRKAPKG